MKVLVRLSVETRRGGLVARQEQEQLLPPEQVTVLNEHGDVTLGQGARHRRTWPGKSGKWCICVTCNSQSKSLWGNGAIPLHWMIL